VKLQENPVIRILENKRRFLLQEAQATVMGEFLVTTPTGTSAEEVIVCA
jgi:hypothetical protein